MARYDLGKWDLKELVKKPTRAEIDKKLAKLESSTKRFKKTFSHWCINKSWTN